MQAVMNTVFGELFRLKGEAPEVARVTALRGAFRSDECPADARLLTCGVDVQGDRLVYAVRAWGDRYTSWLLRHGELWGETEHITVWNDLAALLELQWTDRRIWMMLVDSGFRADMVYAFARRFPGRVLPSKGHDELSKPAYITKIDVTPQGKPARAGVTLAHVDASYFKSWVHGRIAWPADQPGAWHLPVDASDDYCEQLVAESRVLKASGRVVWVRSRKANHYLDAEVLNAAAAHLLSVHKIQPPQPVVDRVAVPAPMDMNAAFAAGRPDWLPHSLPTSPQSSRRRRGTIADR
jgi:phage terminase large subunit GpA-like protein